MNDFRDEITAAQETAVQKTEFYFDSSDGRSRLHALKWLPDSVAEDGLQGVVLIVHGMVEHIERYDDFARFLAACGYAVYGASHIGHGKSVSSPKDWGVLPENGAQVMVSDVHTLRCMARRELGESVPVIVFGHSMGSFVVRSYLARYGRGLTAALICGTGQQPVAASRLAGFLSRSIGRRKGFDYRSSFIQNLAMGSYAKSVENPRTEFDWLNTDPAQVDLYIADPACGAMFSVGGFASLTDLTAETAGKACASAVPDGLPVLFIAGAEDPVGDKGKGVRAAAEAMRTHSKADVSLTLYDGMRHEILNEPGHAAVYADVLSFIRKAVAEPDAVSAEADAVAAAQVGNESAPVGALAGEAGSRAMETGEFAVETGAPAAKPNNPAEEASI